MFSIIISEKGGAERRESFDKNEINVGRVQGNDLMLPKGNVSKHHARLLYRDGRFIVTDLKSTNGTYVNGRKIAQATIVREGDKIYIGDFVIRLEGQAGDAPAEASPGIEDESIRTLARDRDQVPPRPGVPAVTLKAPTHPPGAPLPKPMNAVVTTAAPQRAPEPPPPPPTPPPSPSPPPAAADADDEDEGSGADYQLDKLPEDDGTPQPKPAPAPAPANAPRASVAPPPEPPRPIAGVAAPERPARPHTMPLQAMPNPPRVGAPNAPVRATIPPVPGPPPAAAPPPREPSRDPIVREAAAPPPAREREREPSREAREPAREPGRDAPAPKDVKDTKDTPAPPPPASSMQTAPPPPPPRAASSKEQAGRRLALQMLLGRIADATDLARLGQSAIVSDAFSQELERCAKEQAAAMRDEGEAPEGIDLDMLARDAHLELTQLGIVSTLLDDDSVTEIHIPRFDQVLAVRGQSMSPAELAFTSDEALARAIRRIAAQTSHPIKDGETIIERRHAKGSVLAVLPPTSAASVLSIKKRRRVDDKLDDLLRQGRLSKPIASFFEACIQGRANVLVVATTAPSVSSLLAAFAGAAPAGERIAVIYDTDEVHAPQAHVVSLAIGVDRRHAAEVVQATRKMQSARIIVTEMGFGVSTSVLEAVAEGAQGVYAGMTSPSLRQAVSRLTAQLLLARPGLSQEGSRELVAEAFDVGVEIQTGADGVAKVIRVAELNGTDPKGVVLRDIFASTGDGDFTATGVTPKVASELTARGVKLDTSIFKRK